MELELPANEAGLPLEPGVGRYGLAEYDAGDCKVSEILSSSTGSKQNQRNIRIECA